jgi:hypothetical protein
MEGWNRLCCTFLWSHVCLYLNRTVHIQVEVLQIGFIRVCGFKSRSFRGILNRLKVKHAQYALGSWSVLSLTHSLTRSHSDSLIHSLIHPLADWLTHSGTRLPHPTDIQPPTYWLTTESHSPTHSLTPLSLIRTLTHPVTHWNAHIHPLTDSW